MMDILWQIVVLVLGLVGVFTAGRYKGKKAERDRIETEQRNAEIATRKRIHDAVKADTDRRNGGDDWVDRLRYLDQ